jgi:hypothetical protein
MVGVVAARGGAGASDYVHVMVEGSPAFTAADVGTLHRADVAVTVEARVALGGGEGGVPLVGAMDAVEALIACLRTDRPVRQW